MKGRAARQEFEATPRQQILAISSFHRGDEFCCKGTSKKARN